jgi:hypothetical protein
MIVLRKGKGKEREPQFSDGVNLVSGSIEGGFFFAAGRVFYFPILIDLFFPNLYIGHQFSWIHLMFRYIPGNRSLSNLFQSFFEGSSIICLFLNREVGSSFYYFVLLYS